MKKRKKNNTEENIQQDNIYSNYMNNENNNNGNNFMNNSLNNQDNHNNYNYHNNNNNMNNNYQNSNNNMNNNYQNNNNNMNNNFDNNNNNDNNNPNNEQKTDYNNDNVSHYEYKEKEYPSGSLEKNTVVTKSSAISRFFLIGFYLILLVVGVMAFFMIRANKYEFYLKEDAIMLNSGSTYQIELVPKNEKYFDYLNYDYSIADETVATVDEFGTITATGTGTTTLKISLKPGFINSKTVRIISEDISVTKADIGVYKDGKYIVAKYVDLSVDQSTTIKTIINDRDDLNVASTYTSSNTNVAVVDSFGNVTGKHSGKTIITSNVNGVEAQITVNVKGDKVPRIINPKATEPPTTTPSPSTITKIAFQTNSLSIKKGSTAQLTMIITPESLSSSNLTFTSSDTKIVTVDEKGVINGVNTGKATITATSSNGKTARCDVTVTNNEVNVTKISLNTTKKTINVNEKFQLVATITPSNSTVRRLIWTSDNESVATVDPSSGLVTGKAAGSAVIMVSSNDGKIVAKCTITVQKAVTPAPTTTTAPKTTTSPKVTKVSLGVASQLTKYVGDQLQLSAAVEPSTVTKYTVTWKSSNTSVATVSSNGLVKMVSAGTVEITADVNGVKAKVTIVVRTKTTTTSTTTSATPPAGTQFTGTAKNYVSVDNTKLTITKGSKSKFKISLKGAAGMVKVTSSDSSVAKVILPVDDNVGICNGSTNICFLDGLVKADEIEIEVSGLKTGTAYINVEITDIPVDEGNLSGTAKVGILVK